MQELFGRNRDAMQRYLTNGDGDGDGF